MNSRPTWTTSDPVSDKSATRQTKRGFVSPVWSTRSGQHARWQEVEAGQRTQRHEQNRTCSSKHFVCHGVICGALSSFLLSVSLSLRYLICSIVLCNLCYYGFVVYFNIQKGPLFYLCFLCNIDLAIVQKAFAESSFFQNFIEYLQGNIVGRIIIPRTLNCSWISIFIAITLYIIY